MRRGFLAFLVLLSTLVTTVATPTASFADDDHGRRGNDDRRGRDHDDKRDHDDDKRDRDDDRRERQGNNNLFRTVGICHATGSERHPFVFIRVAEESVIVHQRHGDIIGVSSQRDCPQQGGATGVVAATGSVNIGDTVCREGDMCVFTVWQSRGTGAANVTWATEDGTATGGPSCTAGIDYVSNTGTASVDASSTTTLSIQTCTDNLSGPDERFRVRLTGTSSGRIADEVGRGIVLETSVAAGANTVLGTTDSAGQITISWGSTGGIEHRVYFATGTACLFGTDFRSFLSTATSGILTGLTPNTVYCLQARRVEVGGVETVLTASAMTAASATTVGNIAISDATCVEGAICSFTVTQTSGTAAATVTFSTGIGTAVGGATCGLGADFMQTTGGSVSVPANGSVSIPVTTCADGIVDPNETFFVVLNTTTSGTISDTTGFGTILGG